MAKEVVLVPKEKYLKLMADLQKQKEELNNLQNEVTVSRNEEVDDRHGHEHQSVEVVGSNVDDRHKGGDVIAENRDKVDDSPMVGGVYRSVNDILRSDATKTKDFRPKRHKNTVNNTRRKRWLKFV